MVTFSRAHYVVFALLIGLYVTTAMWATWLRDANIPVLAQTIGPETVAWTALRNMSVAGNTLTKNGGSNDGVFDGSAISAQRCVSGDCYLEFTATELSNPIWIGFSTDTANSSADAGSINYALHYFFYSGGGFYETYALEGGQYKGERYPTPPGARLRLAIEGGIIKYYYNGVAFYTSTAVPSYPLVIKAVTNKIGAGVSEVLFGTGSAGGSGTGAPTVGLAAAPVSISSGQSSTLSWSSTNATSCIASGGWSGSKTGSGYQSVAPGSTTTFTLTCTGSGGTASKSVTVTVTVSTNPAPTLTISANPASISSGGSSTLSWSSTNATSCTASGGWSGTKAFSGSQSVSPSTGTTYILICTGAGGSISQSATVSVASGSSSGGSGKADPTKLPVAVGAMPLTNAPAVAGGASYLDPISGARVWRATADDYPCNPNLGERHHDYGDTNQISLPWGNGMYTLLIRTCGQYQLVDFQPGVGFSNWRPFAAGASPGHDLEFVFSYNSVTPRIAFVLRGGTLLRYNTATNQIENTGNFPRTGWDAQGWLQVDMYDTWFVANNTAQTACTAWNSRTNATIGQTWPAFDECHLENYGRYVNLNTGDGGDGLWDLTTNQIYPFDPPTGHIFHHASLQGYFTSVDVNSGGADSPAHYRLNPATRTGTKVMGGRGLGYFSLFHHSGAWINQGVPDDQQWYLMSTYGHDANGYCRGEAVCFVKLDGSDARFLAHTYNTGDGYWDIARAQVGPDGRLVMFGSKRVYSSAGDVYVAEVPTGNGSSVSSPTPSPSPTPTPSTISGPAACQNPTAIPSGFSSPCPVFSVFPASLIASQNLTISLSPDPTKTVWLYKTLYISEGNTWKSFTLPGTVQYTYWLTGNVSWSITPQQAGLASGIHYLASWEWTWDAQANAGQGCYKGPGSSTCNGGSYRLQQITVL